MKTKLLCVDDDRQVIDLVDYCLREEYDCRLFTDVRLALAAVEQEEFAVVIADVIMPAMGGIDFLKRTRELQRDAVCVNMSSHTDLEMVLDALRANHIYDFIQKPLRRDPLLACVARAVERYGMIKDRHRLTQELSRKNQELAEWNQRLDEEVRRRTRELQLRDDILQHLCGGKTSEQPFALVTSLCSDFFPQCLLAIYTTTATGDFCLIGECDGVGELAIELPAAAVSAESLSELSGPALREFAAHLRLPARFSACLVSPLTRFEATIGALVLAGPERFHLEQLAVFNRLMPLVTLMVYDHLAQDRLDEIAERLAAVDLPA